MVFKSIGWMVGCLTQLNVDPVIQMAYVGIQLIFKIPLAINMGQVQACKP